MFDWLKVRFGSGIRTSSFPRVAPTLPERFRGRPSLQPASDRTRSNIDLGSCLFSPEEAGSRAGGVLRFTSSHRMASSTRAGLVVSDGEAPLVRALDAEMQRLFRRSLRLRSVVCGSCGGCEAELNALDNVVFDMARFGVQFVASPRHADGLVVTGIVNRNMRDALERTYAAMPRPRLVIAVGACAIAGGPFAGSAEAAAPPSFPIDLYVPGCPPHPFTLLDGLLRLLGRLPSDH